MTIGLITARGGSTRTPRKNLADVCGVPLVAWSILQSRCSRMIDDTYLTTDDDEIATVGMQYGAKIIRRPILDNGVTAGVVFLDALRQLARRDINPDIIVTILPTSPLRKPNEFDRMIRAHLETGHSITTACPMKETYIFRNTVPFQDRFMTQDEYCYYHAHALTADKHWNYSKLAGGAAVASPEWYEEQWKANPVMDADIDRKPVNHDMLWTFVPVEEWQTFDVDYPADLELVRTMMAHYILAAGGASMYHEYKAGDQYDA